MRFLHLVTWVLIIIGGINWGLVGAFNFNLVEKVLGTGNLSEIVYCLVGLSALYEVVTHGKRCRMCNPDGSKMMSM